jgi:putative DNA primase/helicase
VTIDLNADAEPRYDIPDLKRRLRSRAAEIFPPLFPQARIQGNELRMANIHGDRPKKSGSCKVNLKGDHAGDWHDFATGQKGDVLDTLARATGLAGRALLAKAAEIVGASPSSGRRHQLSKMATSLNINPPPQLPPPTSSNGHDSEVEQYLLAANACRVKSIVDQSIPLRGTPGEAYFEARGLPPSRCLDLRFVADLTDFAAMRVRPAIIALLRSPDGQTLPAIHRTYLADDCRAKADMPKPKMLLGPSRGGVIALAPISPEGILGIGEGIENSLSAMALFNIPCWSAISAGGMRIFAEALARGQPRGLKDLRIFADRGLDGENAAGELRRAAERLGIVARIFLPQSDDDCNKDLRLGLRPVEEIGPLGPDWVDREPFVSEKVHERDVEQALDEFYAAGRRYDGRSSPWRST